MLSKRRQTHKNIYYTVLFTRSIRTGKTNLWRQKAESVCSEVGGLTVRASHELSRVTLLHKRQNSSHSVLETYALYVNHASIKKEEKVTTMVVANIY